MCDAVCVARIPTFANLPMLGEFRAGAVFHLLEPSQYDLDVRLPGIGSVASVRDLDRLVVRLSRDCGNAGEAKRLALDVGQKVLDSLSAHEGWDLGIKGVRGNEVHLLWWSGAHGPTLRWTHIDNIDGSLLRKLEEVAVRLPMTKLGSLRGTGWAPWHASFRYYRAMQLSSDLLDAFRNGFLAVECLLDSVLPRSSPGATSTQNETDWMAAALEVALTGVDLEGHFTDPSGLQTSPKVFMQRCYKDLRTSVFHSKLSYGLKSVRFPYSVDDQKVRDVELMLDSLKFLYRKLAAKHLGSHFRGSFTLNQTLWDACMSKMVGNLTIHVSDDSRPVSTQLHDTTFNPCGAWTHPLHTRHDSKFARPLATVFKGVMNGFEVGEGRSIRCAVGEVAGDGLVMIDLGGAALGVEGFDRLEVIVGLTAFNQGHVRRAFLS